MALVQMRHIEIIALQQDAKAIVDLLQRLGTVDVTERDSKDVTEDLKLFSSKNSLNQLDKSYAMVQHAISLVEEYAGTKKSLLAGFEGRKELTEEEFNARIDKMDAVMKYVYDIEAQDRTISSETTVLKHTKQQLDAILPWENLDIPMQFEGTSKTSCLVGFLPEQYDVSELEHAIKEQFASIKQSDAQLKGQEFKADELSFPDLYIEIVYSSSNQTCVCVMTHKRDYEDVNNCLRRLSFTTHSDPTKHAPEVRINRLKARSETADTAIREAKSRIKSYADKLDDLYFLSDYLIMRHDKYEMLGQLLFSDKAFILDGFVAAEDEEKVLNELNSKFNLYVDCRDPLPEEEVPAKFKNNAFVSPVEDIVESYSGPSSTDIDPNPVMSFFYYFFFGMMLSDAGYGLLMAIGTLFVLIKAKPEGNNRKNMLKFLYCGIASVFWGLMFGSFFGNVVGAISTGFFDGSVSLPPLWFDPNEDPMFLLILSLVLGFIHILVGLGANFYKLWKNGDKVSAICDVGFWYVSFAGIVLVILPMAITTTLPLATIGKWVAIAGAAGLVLTGGRNSPKLMGKILGGFGSLYNVSGYFSDLLSYSRLMALGLVTGIVGSVANTIGTLFGTGIVKWIIFIIVFVFFHSVNMAISALGAYVHVNRLQYVEFFTKFYDGGGKMFKPFAINTKHYKFKEDN